MNSWSSQWLKRPADARSCRSAGSARPSLYFAHFCGTVSADDFANGSKAFPKERLEVFAAGRVLQLDNFRKLTSFGWPGFTKMNLWRQDKGQKACASAFVDAVSKGGSAPIPAEEVFEVTRISIELAAM